jgi:hypothetical protein
MNIFINLYLFIFTVTFIVRYYQLNKIVSYVTYILNLLLLFVGFILFGYYDGNIVLNYITFNGEL